jgi:hypothetical protein
VRCVLRRPANDGGLGTRKGMTRSTIVDLQLGVVKSAYRARTTCSRTVCSCGPSLRNNSVIGNGSGPSPPKVAQLSSELRTRLSYAMVKVKNGWQPKTIDEVESLASRKGSPASSTSSKTGISVPIYHN